MKTLLTEIRKRLSSEVTMVKGDAGVHLIPDENLIPETTPFPCIGIKDGGVSNHYYLGMHPQKAKLTVSVHCFVLVDNLDTVLVGTDENPGILDLAQEAREALEAWTPSSAYKWMNGDVEETESITLRTADDNRLQRKSFKMTWHRTDTV